MWVLVTGMSGAGKSTVLRELGGRGHRVVDTDTDEWSTWTTDADGAPDWVWRVDALTDLLTGHRDGALFVAGCRTNQVELYPLFEHVVLLHAPPEVLLDRIDARDTNPYGKSAAERAQVLRDIVEVVPLLREGATAELDATAPVAQVADRLEALLRR